MDMVGKKVTHSIFGEGHVTEQNDISIMVDFGGEVKRFLYPQAFDHHLIAMDDEIHETLSERAEELIDEEEKKRQEDVEARRQERLRDPEVIAKREKARRSSAAGKQKAIAFRYEDIVSQEEGEEDERDPNVLPAIDEWKVDAGYYKSGNREGKPIVMREARRNAVALLTYVKPDQKEEERVIFALFLAGKAFEGDDRNAGYLESDGRYRLELTQEEAGQLLYWNYYSNKNRSPRTTWGSGQFRYIEQEVAAQVLREAAELKKGTEDEELAEEFFLHFCELQNINPADLPAPEGALVIREREEAGDEE